MPHFLEIMSEKTHLELTVCAVTMKSWKVLAAFKWTSLEIFTVVKCLITQYWMINILTHHNHTTIYSRTKAPCSTKILFCNNSVCKALYKLKKTSWIKQTSDLVLLLLQMLESGGWKRLWRLVICAQDNHRQLQAAASLLETPPDPDVTRCSLVTQLQR